MSKFVDQSHFKRAGFEANMKFTKNQAYPF